VTKNKNNETEECRTKVNLYTQYYLEKDQKRRIELDICLGKNLQNKLINKVYLFNETHDIPIISDKIDNIKVDSRITYSEMFKIINDKTGENDINILANSDIYLDSHNIEKIFKINLNNVCLALTRWNVNSDGSLKFNHQVGGQDCWIFKGRIREIQGDFTTGKWGCDYKIAFEIHKAGYKIYNPALSIQTYHLHLIAKRNYMSELPLPQPWKTLPPIALENFFVILFKNIFDGNYENNIKLRFTIKRYQRKLLKPMLSIFKRLYKPMYYRLREFYKW
jgi:hypothetical protein